MSKAETALQARIQKLVKSRGGYIQKNHGNMITEVGLSDLHFTYKGVPVYFEVKTPDNKDGVTPAQGIHLRLAKKAGAVSAVITDIETASYILNLIDEYRLFVPTFDTWLKDKTHDLQGLPIKRWNDGSKY